jgi:hypothetical protein
MSEEDFRDIFGHTREQSTMMLSDCIDPLCVGFCSLNRNGKSLVQQYSSAYASMTGRSTRYKCIGNGPTNPFVFSKLVSMEGSVSAECVMMLEYMGEVNARRVLAAIDSAFRRWRHRPHKAEAERWLKEIEEIIERTYGEDEPRVVYFDAYDDGQCEQELQAFVAQCQQESTVFAWGGNGMFVWDGLREPVGYHGPDFGMGWSSNAVM